MPWLGRRASNLDRTLLKGEENPKNGNINFSTISVKWCLESVIIIEKIIEFFFLTHLESWPDIHGHYIVREHTYFIEVKKIYIYSTK